MSTGLGRSSRQREVFFARLAENTERYDDMRCHVEAFCQEPGEHELSDEERGLMFTAFATTIRIRQKSVRVFVAAEQKEREKGNEQQALFAKERCAEMVAEIQRLSHTIVGVLHVLIMNASTAKPRARYLNMKANIYRRVMEFVEGDVKTKAADDARRAYEEAWEMVKKDLPAEHGSDGMGFRIAMDYSDFQHEINDTDAARKRVLKAFEDAVVQDGGRHGLGKIVMYYPGLAPPVTPWQYEELRKFGTEQAAKEQAAKEQTATQTGLQQSEVEADAALATGCTQCSVQ
jgi:hypothetical protein